MDASEPLKENIKLFRTAAFGYNKQDVNDYIEKLAKSRKRDGERCEEAIKSVKEELQQTKQKLSQVINERDEYKEKAESESEREADISEYEDLKKSYALLKDELDDVSEKLRLSNDVCETQKSEMDHMQSQIDKLSVNAAEGKCEAESKDRLEKLEDKVRRYELERARMKELEEDSARRARDIVEQAEIKASQINDAAGESRKSISKALESAREKLEELSKIIGAME